MPGDNAARRIACFPSTGLVALVFLSAAAAGLAQTNIATGSPSELKKFSLDELLNLEVTTVSRRPEKLNEAPSAIQVITGEDIRRSGATSIPEALRLAPNLEVAQVDSRQWAISARGFNNTVANKLLVLIDGRTVYTPLFAGVFWDVQDTLLADIDRIEVISGPGGSLWGANAVNGVINIITRSAAETQGFYLEGGGGTELRGFGGARYGGQLTPQLHYRVYGKYFDRDSTVLSNGTDGTNEWHVGQGGFRLDWDATNHNLLTLQGDLYDGRIAQPGTNDIAVSGGNTLGHWSHTFSEDSDLRVQLYYDRTRRRIPGTFSEDLNTYDFDGQHRFQPLPRNDFVWGIGFRLIQDQVDNGTALAFLPAHKTLHLYSAFLQDEVTLVTDRLRLTLGSKFEHNDYTGFEIQPSVRLAWTPDIRQTVWGAISRAVRSPSRIDREFYAPAAPPYLLAGGTNFLSEDLLAYELGYRVQPIERLSLSVATYYNDYDHIRSLRPGSPFVIANDLKGESYGVELAGTLQITDWWRVRAGYNYLHKRLVVKPGGADLNNGSGEGNDPEHQFSFRSSMDLPGDLQLDAGLRFVDSLPSPSVPSYFGLDVRLQWKPAKDWELAVVGQNLVDRRHPEFGAPATREEIERSVYGRVTWSF